MDRALPRRTFLRRALLTSGAVAVGGGAFRSALAGAAVVPGPGPYGPLAATPDANGFLLPAGFASRLLATSRSAVRGGYVWHDAPDGGACFPVPGGWVYVSNSEVGSGLGGASALRFGTDGRVVEGYRILSGTSRNCAGGRTVNGTWLSCEENGSAGIVHECDPTRAGQGVARPALGMFNHEAAVEDPVARVVYLTEDDDAGRLYRFVPATPGDLSAGQLFAASVVNGAISWVPAGVSGPDRQPTTTAFAGGEGLWIEGRRMYLTTKTDKRVWEVDLDAQRISVLYDARVTPGAALNAVDNCTVHTPSGDLYVCEDGGNMEVGIVTAAASGASEVAAFLRIVGHDASEWAGVAFSPDHSRMYLSSQRGNDGRGRTYEITGPFRRPGPPAPVETLVATGSTWRFSDTGADLGTAWRGLGFDAGAWRSGAAPLGYGDPVATTVSFGPDPNRKHVTTYFRRTFTATRGHTALTLRLRRDDGAVVYLNGQEVARSNMPAGTVTAATFASSAVAGSDETRFFDLAVSGQLYAGDNVLAVELHQSDRVSSDLLFDAALIGTGDTGPLPPPPPPPPPPPGVTTVLPTEDTHVRDGSWSSTNFGSATLGELRTASAAGDTRRYYVEIDTRAHVGPVGRAVLRLWAQAPAGATVPIDAYAVDPAAWSAATLTNGNRPPLGAWVAKGQVTGGAAGWFELDVTAHVRAERAAGRPVVSYLLRPPSSSPLVTVATAESGATTRPRMELRA